MSLMLQPSQLYVTTVATVTTIIVKYEVLLLYSIKGNFFTKSTDGPTDRQKDRPTTRLLELLWAANNIKVNSCILHFN